MFIANDLQNKVTFSLQQINGGVNKDRFIVQGVLKVE